MPIGSRTGRPNPVQQALPSHQEFKKVIHDFKVTSHEHLRSAPWLSQGNPFTQRKVTSFTPFAQKLSVPHGSEIAFFGDLHGNKKALDECILALQRDVIFRRESRNYEATILLYLSR